MFLNIIVILLSVVALDFGYRHYKSKIIKIHEFASKYIFGLLVLSLALISLYSVGHKGIYLVLFQIVLGILAASLIYMSKILISRILNREPADEPLTFVVIEEPVVDFSEQIVTKQEIV